MMNHSQWLAAIIVEQVLLGKNLDKSFNLILSKYNSEEMSLSQTKDMVYGAIRDLGKSKFYIYKLVKKKLRIKLLKHFFI